MDQLKVSVSYYNDREKENFKSPKYDDIRTFLDSMPGDISIPEDEFKGYMMFPEQDDSEEGSVSFEQLSKRIGSRFGDFNENLDIKNSINAILSPQRMNVKNYTESIGVSLGLCIANKMYGLTKADWKKIPEKSNKTLDFKIASTGEKYIQVENKGVVKENANTKNKLFAKYKSIKEKKTTEGENSDDVLFGTIAVIDKENTAKVWLVDPEPIHMNMEPKKYKLLARLYYYLDEFRDIGLNESIIKSLSTRITQITKEKDYLRYDNQSLDFNDIEGNVYGYIKNRLFFAVLDTNFGFGNAHLIKYKGQDYFYLVAFSKEVIDLIISQNFNDILKYTYTPRTIEMNINVSFSEKDVEPETYTQTIAQTSDGKLFGLLRKGKNAKPAIIPTGPIIPPPKTVPIESGSNEAYNKYTPQIKI